MPHTISSIAAELESLSASDFDDGQGMQKLSRVCEALERRADGPELIPLLFKTMERLRELDLGQPGPLVHTLEHWVGQYEGELIASLQRQPMYLTVWMVSRILNGESRDTRKWKAILRQVIRHPNASQDVKHDAEEYLDNHK